MLRSALSLAAATGTPFRMTDVRGARDNPGLRRQHVTAARAAAAITGGEVSGDRIGSREVEFRPGPVRGGEWEFSTGGAGSAPLVLQTVLPVLATAGEASRVVVEGGTHNPYAPPFEFLDRVYGSFLDRMGPETALHLDRPGFYPSGGGRLRATVEPTDRLKPVRVVRRGSLLRRRARALISDLPRHVGERELGALRGLLQLDDDEMELVTVTEPRGPGNALVVALEFEGGSEVCTGFGRKGLPAEEVARRAARRALEFLDSEVPVGKHLADQLLVPLALAGGGEFRTLPPSAHTRTNARVIREFTDLEIDLREEAEGRWTVEVR